MKGRDILVAGAVALVATGITELPALDRLRDLSIDLLFGLRHSVMGPRTDPSESHTVVVAIDEETYRRPPFKDVPKVMWTPQIARVMNAVLAGGASVVGFDMILPTSVEPYISGFDRDLLIALRAASQQNKVVLTMVQHQAKPITPYPGYSFAVGHAKNIRAANLFEDSDGVIRRAPLLFRSLDAQSRERTETSLALELAARTLGQAPRITADGGVSLDGYSVPESRDGNLLINFDGGSHSIPTYSLADLFACAEQDRTVFFREKFAGKTVLFGAVLDVEDRKLTAKRFATGHAGVGASDRCILDVMPGLNRSDVDRNTIAGVYIHAAIVNNLLRHDALRDLSTPGRLLTVFIIALAASIAVVALSPLAAGATVIAGLVAGTGVATAVFHSGGVVPFLPAVAASLLSFLTLTGYRFAIADKDKRILRKSFGLYLPPALVDRLADSNTTPALGGETQELTVFFSDIEGFTSLSEGLPPQQLVAFLNAYFKVVSGTIEEHGGIIDKYIGDAVVAIFGAPLADPEHARHAVDAALACQQRLAEMQHELGLPGSAEVRTRIGINTGEMVVGNIGSRRRFNYTVIGDAVNLASRLESANKNYGTQILVSERTAQACGESPVFREIDRVRVAGRRSPVALFEPLDPSAPVSEELRQRLNSFAEALALYRARRFSEAAAIFGPLGDDDPVARNFAKRTNDLVQDPPAEDWNGVTDLDGK